MHSLLLLTCLSNFHPKNEVPMRYIPRSLLAMVVSMFMFFMVACGAPNVYDPCEGGVNGCSSEQTDTDHPTAPDNGDSDEGCNEALLAAEEACVAAGGNFAGTCVEGVPVFSCAVGDNIIDSYNDNSSTTDDHSSNSGDGGEDGDDVFECNDGVDNDGDGLTDYASDGSGDLGCTSPYDDDETDTDDGEEAIDILGAYYCDSAWSPANDTSMISEVVEQDTDFDSVTDQIWINGVLEFEELWVLDVDANNSVDSGWGCVSSPDGTNDYTDDDGDGYAEVDGDWDDRSAGNRPGADEVCGDGMDNDCDGAMDEICSEDLDRDGYSPLQGDCNDDASTLHPYADEMSNGVDDDCDGTIDDPSGVDSDGDGYCESGVDSNGDEDCFDSGESSTTTYDCAEGNADVHPGATDWGDDGVDNDCDGTIDEG